MLRSTLLAGAAMAGASASRLCAARPSSSLRPSAAKYCSTSALGCALGLSQPLLLSSSPSGGVGVSALLGGGRLADERLSAPPRLLDEDGLGLGARECQLARADREQARHLRRRRRALLARLRERLDHRLPVDGQRARLQPPVGRADLQNALQLAEQRHHLLGQPRVVRVGRQQQAQLRVVERVVHLLRHRVGQAERAAYCLQHAGRLGAVVLAHRL
eukprot:176763-Pleurochrysis_carterae.AAC.4